MKTKILLSVLAIGLSIALIGGATMAWFTDDAEVPAAEFTAGTVLVDVDEGSPEYLDDYNEDNVNPGDCTTITWNIINEGTKDAEFRVKLDELWRLDQDMDDELWSKLYEEYKGENSSFNKSDLEEMLDTDNVYYAPAPDSDWVMYSTGGEIWLYYTGGPVPGTFDEGDEANRTVELKLIIAFDGELTDNKYMGAEFTLGGIVEAVQASNDAPSEVWGSVWEEVKEGVPAQGNLANRYLNYIKETECWPENGDDE